MTSVTRSWHEPHPVLARVATARQHVVRRRAGQVEQERGALLGQDGGIVERLRQERRAGEVPSRIAPATLPSRTITVL